MVLRVLKHTFEYSIGLLNPRRESDKMKKDRCPICKKELKTTHYHGDTSSWFSVVCSCGYQRNGGHCYDVAHVGDVWFDETEFSSFTHTKRSYRKIRMERFVKILYLKIKYILRKVKK